MKRDHQYLKSRLAERSSSPDRSAEIDQQLWDELGITCAILVSDMSGLTRITQSHGTLHFLSLVYEGVALSQAHIEGNGGTLLKQEADNMLCIFDGPDQALRAAVGILEALRVHNAGIADRNSQIGLCLGIGFGRVIRPTDEIFGDEVNIAYKLGEDIAGLEEILLSEAAVDGLSGPVEGCRLGDWEQVEIGGVGLRHRKATLLQS